MKKILWLTVVVFVASWMHCSAQQFINLMSEELAIDSVLPCLNYEKYLGTTYRDSLFTATIEYPEFIDMTAKEIERYKAICGLDEQSMEDAPALPELPVVEQHIGVARKKGTLYMSLVPLVFREGRYQKLVSFKLSVKATEANGEGGRRAVERAERYADHSVLASGKWVKIRVPETGIYHLTDQLISQAGFSDPSKVKVYGYGGAMQPEKLTADYLSTHDDLMEVPTCTVSGKRLFYAVGPVNWDTSSSTSRTRNPYSDYGYYFLTESDDPLTVDSAAFASSFYPSPNDYHSLYEVDDYCWYHGGRNLYDQRTLNVGSAMEYPLQSFSRTGKLTVAMSYDGYCDAEVAVNGTLVGNTLINSTTASKSNKKLKSLPDDYSVATADTWVFNVSSIMSSDNTVTITKTSGSTMRLDYVALTSSNPKPFPHLSEESFPVPEYVCDIANQDLHADPQADMVIIVPTNRILLGEAERIKQLHENYDGMRVNIVVADELFNEFSSGTPDANAYRRYMKMLYDRAADEDDQPKYLLLFGDGAWDNRMLSTNWRSTSPDDFLLCYESDNSFSETKCYVSDDYFCLLDDDEGTDMVTDKIDAAVGRFPARTPEDAKILVDKTYSYRLNDNAGAWQNTICFLGDDGDKNRHMNDEELVSAMVAENHPGFNTKKVYWDAYQRIETDNGSKYPEVTNLIKQQMQAGALIMNYSGHGSPIVISHENVLTRADFATPTSLRLPLWVTASCDIMPFDGQEENIGETAMFNPEGGAIAFFGTTRTVYAAWNRPLNISFTDHVLSSVDGRRNTIGEAAVKAKNEFTVGSSRDMIVNKQQYTLLGDPALVLAAPTLNAIIDEIDGHPATDSGIRLLAGTQVTVNGHMEGSSNFNGMVTLTVRDVEEKVKCHMNVYNKGDTALVYTHRPSTIFTGSNGVQNGTFSFTFTVPKDISYSDDNGQMLVYAINDDRTLLAHGENDNFSMGGGGAVPSDGVGPQIYCFLENEMFTDGATVGPTPYFYAMLKDDDGINVSGNGIGHDVELIIDNRLGTTYNLNDRFQYSYGDYTTGTVEYTLPQLRNGLHHMIFRAWDVLNNSSVVEYDFYVADQGVAGIDDINVVGGDASQRHSTLFDLQGRPLSSQPSHGRQSKLVLMRGNDGRVKVVVR